MEGEIPSQQSKERWGDGEMGETKSERLPNSIASQRSRIHEISIILGCIVWQRSFSYVCDQLRWCRRQSQGRQWHCGVLVKQDQ